MLAIQSTFSLGVWWFSRSDLLVLGALQFLLLLLCACRNSLSAKQNLLFISFFTKILPNRLVHFLYCTIIVQQFGAPSESNFVAEA